MTTINPDSISVELEFTPNPNTLKYLCSTSFMLSGSVNFQKRDDAVGVSDLALELFDLGKINAVMIGKNYVTITLLDQDTLTELNDQIINTIKNFVSSGRSAVKLEAVAPTTHTDTANLSDLEKQIVKILDEEIRPSVAMDGGDIVFHRFEDGIVYVQMQGSCSGCPSSTATLKMGIENRLRDAIPQVLEVVAV